MTNRLDLNLFLTKMLERFVLKRVIFIIFENNTEPYTLLGFRKFHSIVYQVHKLVDATSSTNVENSTVFSNE